MTVSRNGEGAICDVVSTAALGIAMLLATPAFAQQASREIEMGGQLYIHSIGLPKEAQVCERHIPGYLTLFNPLYASWKERHQQLMDRALQVMKAESEKAGKSLDPMVAELTDGAAARLATVHVDLIWENCLNRLLALRKSTSPGAGNSTLDDYRPR